MPRSNQARSYLLSRLVLSFVVVTALSTLCWKPSSIWQHLADILFRTYLMFLGTVMAHEGVHGHLGRTKKANFWWGRIALIPCMVPFSNFHKTHRLHHAHTNIPDKDPDYFLKSRNCIELIFRALAMPHHWFFWLKKRGLIRKRDVTELALNYVAVFTVYGMISLRTGLPRLLEGMLPSLVLVSLLLWYPFAIKTHEGYSTGSEESRSHNYYGSFMYWFSLGLSMHRVHHMRPELSWIELKDYAQKCPKGLRWRLVPRRDVRITGQTASITAPQATSFWGKQLLASYGKKLW